MSRISPPPAALHVASPAGESGSPPGQPYWWAKIARPGGPLPAPDEAGDVRVLISDDPGLAGLREELQRSGATLRSLPYLLEQEVLTGIDGGASTGQHTVDEASTVRGARLLAEPVLPGGSAARGGWNSGPPAAVARLAFEELWQTLERFEGPGDLGIAASSVVPAPWAAFLPHPQLNPAQTQAAGAVLSNPGHLLVVAPTGTGKTTIGMLAALRAVLGERRKAAWLVPQRSLTDELDRELDSWRAQGLRVERLSGEFSVDLQRVRDADLWVATTEKFEAMCRTSSLRETLTEVGCLIVDEIHLLGDPDRGPVLEALLARVREDTARVRIVGLSATISNAEDLAAWLNASLVRIAWRPTRLIWQLPMVPQTPDWTAAQAARTRLTNRIVSQVTSDGGSVLVFCGSKFSVRSTALAIAASRGVRTSGIRPDDSDALHQVCAAAGVGLHYKDWEHKRHAERAFRERTLDVLVATTTVAAGVNLPARAVVVRDTQAGRRDLDIATVQQMFGRAGRLGAGESTGWAFMIVDAAERAHWQRCLITGYSVESQLRSSLPDQVLAEVAQGRVRSSSAVSHWWHSTFSHHQSGHGAEPAHQSLEFLAGAGYCDWDEQADPAEIRPTPLGVLTTRVMVPTRVGHLLRTALGRARVPDGADDAEDVLIDLLSTGVPKLAQAPLAEHLKATVTQMLQLPEESLAPAARSAARTPDADSAAPGAPAARFDPGQASAAYVPGDLARAALRLLARNPEAFIRPGREIEGIPLSTLHPVLDDAARYLHWLGCQGYLGTIHPWASIVAADLARRVRWRRCGARRGGGRLLWMCEHMAGPEHADREVPELWHAARDRGLTSPDWGTPVPPSGNRLTADGYEGLLQQRVSDSELPSRRPHGAALETGLSAGPGENRLPAGRMLTTWDSTGYWAAQHGRVNSPPDQDINAHDGPAGRQYAIFSWRGDYRATGWLADYHQASAASPPHGAATPSP